MNKFTRDLIRLVERQAGEANSYAVAQAYIEGGADITAQVRDGSMIDVVIREEARLRPTQSWKADNCVLLIDVLRHAASRLLATQVLSSNSSDINQIRLLIRLYAKTYQPEVYGALGLLGDLLRQDRTAIQLDVVQLLIESDTTTYAGLTAENDAGETCLSIARANPKCDPKVIKYLQHKFDQLLNKIPFSPSPIHLNEVSNWIRRGANPEMADEKGNTVLSNAVLTNNLDLVRILVSCGCNTSSVNAQKLTPLDIAQKATPINRLLIAALQGQSVNMELKRLIETKKSHLTTADIVALLNKGANINAAITNYGSFLHLLIGNEGSPAMITAFVNEFKADITVMDGRGCRAVEKCILVDKEPFVVLQTFLTLPKVTTAMFFNTKLNRTLLQYAVEQKCDGAVAIIQKALNERLWNCAMKSTAQDAANHNLMVEIKELVGYGAQINYKHTETNYREWTVLHIACQKTNQTFVRFLTEQMKSDHLMPNGSGYCPIAIAAKHGHLSIVEYLWKLPESDLNVMNKDQETPLHLATEHQHLEIVRFLVRWGADPQAQDRKRRTPLDIAKAIVSNKKEDALTTKKLIRFLEQLVCPSVKTSINSRERATNKPNIDQDSCELVEAIAVQEIHIGDTDPERRSMKRVQRWGHSANDHLHEAAKKGSINDADEAISEGADIGYRKHGHTAYDVALQVANECYARLQTLGTNYNDYAWLHERMQSCQYVAGRISQVAQLKLIEAIEQSNTGLAVAYQMAGAPLTDDLLYRACSSHDNVEILHYLIYQCQMFQSLYTFTRPESPYQTARKNKLSKVSSYIKYVLSVECTKAIEENNLTYVQQLVRGGASVDMRDTDNLQKAFNHQNIELVQLICENGAKMPKQWLQSPNILLPANETQGKSTEMVACLNRCLANRRLRLAAASGDLPSVIQCQRLGANIDSMNCYGSTAVFCAIQYGNYFPIVHALVSCGASILNCNQDEPRSLIELAKDKQYDAIAAYLTKELNNQFIISIINDGLTGAEKFDQFHGVDFNFQDEDQRTPLHYAVQYHDIALVQWLCDRESLPMHADINGDYPVILATQKGDYPVVKLFVLKYPGTKNQTNRDGLTALQIAQKRDFRRIVQLIETGEEADAFDDNSKPQGPKHTPEKLREAAQKGDVNIIKEFREERYNSKDEKRQLCYELLHIAKQNEQFQVVDILEPYYNTELQPDVPSDMTIGTPLTLKERYKKVLLGFLTGLGNVIADSPIILDPNDPQTYKSLFSGLTSKLSKRLKQLKQVKNEKDAQQLYQQDSAKMNEKLGQITEKSQELEGTRKETITRIHEREEQLAKHKDLSALQRKTLFEENEEDQRQLAVFDCSMALYRREQEAIVNRQKALKFISADTNLYLFYCTIENRLKSLLHAVLSAQSGDSTTGASSTAPLVFAEVIMSAVKETLTTVLSQLDEKKQKEEWYNISTMGQIEEVNRIATETAGLMTLYYKEQIQSIENASKIQGMNPYNDQLKLIRDIFTDLPTETAEETAVVIVAEYVTAWIIDALKADRKQIKSDKQMSRQLWYLVARKNLLEKQSSNKDKVSDVVKVQAGQQKIPLNRKKKQTNGEENSVWVQLRYLIGCVSVVGLKGEVYQCTISESFIGNDFDDLAIVGYVYIVPFSSDEKILQSIVVERKMALAVRNDRSDIVTNVDEIKRLVKLFTGDTTERTGTSSNIKEIANQVAQVLHERKTFIAGGDVKAELEKARKVLVFDVDALKEDVQKNMKYYRDSLDATHERIQQESEKNRNAIKKDNEERFTQALNKLSQQWNDMQTKLERMINERMETIEAEMRSKAKEILTIATTAKDQADQTLSQATQAAKASEQSARASEQSMKYSQGLLEKTEQEREELHSVASQCKQLVQTTIAKLEEAFQRNVADIRLKLEQEVGDMKKMKAELVIDVKESKRAAQNAQSTVQDIKKLWKEELEVQKVESKKIISEMQEARKQCEQAAKMWNEIEKHVQQSLERFSREMNQLDGRYRATQDELQNLKKFIKKHES